MSPKDGVNLFDGAEYRFLVHHRKDKRPLNLHLEVEKLLKEEFRSVDDFRVKSKATKECSYSANGASKDETDNSESPSLAEAAAATTSETALAH
ncbi:La-related protein 1A [Nymphaea thermarum]|nr:La-related protein 1A [Nymphaea thermarum]